MHDTNTPIIRALQGAIAALGAPIGWLCIRWIQGFDPLHEMSTHLGLYSYMLLGTLSIFSLFGWHLGTKEQNLQKIALRDALTDLYNVRFFQERLQQEIQSAQRFNTPLTLISFDLDHFKQINDTYGHPAGDEILISISQAAAKILRKHEVLARVGGEEFAALLPRSNIEDGKTTAERLRKKIASCRVKTNINKTISVTVSLGVTSLTESDTPKTFYARADSALYTAKANGRNKVVTF